MQVGRSNFNDMWRESSSRGGTTWEKNPTARVSNKAGSIIPRDAEFIPFLGRLIDDSNAIGVESMEGAQIGVSGIRSASPVVVPRSVDLDRGVGIGEQSTAAPGGPTPVDGGEQVVDIIGQGQVDIGEFLGFPSLKERVSLDGNQNDCEILEDRGDFGRKQRPKLSRIPLIQWEDAAEDEDSENDDDDIAYEDEEVGGMEEGEIRSPKEGVSSASVVGRSAQRRLPLVQVGVDAVNQGDESSGQIITSSQGGTLMLGENGRVEVVFPNVQSVDRALLNADEALQMSARAFTEVGKRHRGRLGKGNSQGIDAA
ncbi:hypothetical protein NE237_026005 [Protea cynaroides]|uniref:Uncharacterized protein n=1 Tax=Protea cynaroides TaxID=273540 RepID=A0A9Q0K033_9MAGN|nr:hypothetical protein NE237_026005 [Protea cynaroides]